MNDKTKAKPLTKSKTLKRSERDASSRRRPANHIKNWLRSDRLLWFILPALSLIIAIMLFPNILRKPKIYRLGDVADRDIKATRDLLIENKVLTEKARAEAVKKVLSVYDFDSSSSNIISRVKEAFNSGRAYTANSFYLDFPGQIWFPLAMKIPAEPIIDEVSLMNRFFEYFEGPPDEKIFFGLLKFGFSEEAEKSVIRLLTLVFGRGVVGNRMMLGIQIDKGGVILHEISTGNEVTVNDHDRFYDVEGARRFITGQKNGLIDNLNSSELAEACIKLTTLLINPNLTFNKRETEVRKDSVRSSVKPFFIKIKKGEMLVREGERIEADHLLKLAGEAQTLRPSDIFTRIPAMTVLIGLLFTIIYLVGSAGIQSFKKTGKDLSFSTVTFLVLFLVILAYNFVAEEVARGFDSFSHNALLFAMPVACGAMLISIFQGIGTAVAFSLIISSLAGLIIDGRVEFFIYFLLSNLVAAYGVRACRERGVLIKAGLKVGLINFILSLTIVVIFGPLYMTEAIIACVSGFVGGLLVGIISTGMIPLVEMSFGFTTDIKLLELANLDQPLLKELLVRAPGTYHHSVIVSSMVEATAEDIEANPLLAKVSAYYHDIGKMKKPLYFIENQMGGENRHEKLAPSMSSLVLISHVKDGVELAKKHKLGREIIDIIRQHQGTSLISFFYNKAQEQMVTKEHKSTRIKEEDFRYPGPRPQTKEAGLVMLADIVEAATRSLVNPTPARVQGTVQKIINKAFSDGQLDECELTLKDLHVIAKSYNKTLSGIFHHRVEYPEMVTKPVKKGSNGSTDQFASKNSGAKKPADTSVDDKGLKRLGLS
ncbi:HD family phosphohydrolase [Thermodesulfobacteriota bacterium]